eukprot:scaffold31371_cov171-Isochrysis_galbana.AAC.1
MNGPSSWLEEEGPAPLVAPCFVVDTLALLEEEALGCVGATVIELGYTSAAADTVTGVLAFAVPPVMRVRIGVVAAQA